MMAFITLILTIGLYMLLGFAAIVITFIIAVLCALGYHAQKNKVKQAQPSKRVCPMCGSPKVRFKYMMNGTTSAGSATTISEQSALHPGAHRFTAAMSHTVRIAGTAFDFITQNDIDAQYNKLNANEGCSILVAVVLGVILAVIWFFGH